MGGPPGFSIESLPPEQVERIEVIRGPTAEHSTQAIAGTINIVLRDGYRQTDIQLRAGDNVSGDLHSPNLSIGLPGQAGNLTFRPFIGINRNDNGSDTFIDHLGSTRPAEYRRLRTAPNDAGATLRTFKDVDHTRTTNISYSGKYTAPMGKGRRLRRQPGSEHAPRGPVRPGRVGRHRALVDVPGPALGRDPHHA